MISAARFQQSCFFSHEPLPYHGAQPSPSCLYAGPAMSTFWNERGDKSKLLVVGHRGCGKNVSLVSDEASPPKLSIKENTITSFNTAAKNGAEFVEFDVQVTKDGHAVVFHDDVIVTEEEGQIVAKHIRDLFLEEFLSIGPQKDSQKVGKTLSRKCVDGSIRDWAVTVDDCLCTLKEVFEQVVQTVGFNIEIKFDDSVSVTYSEIRRTIAAILRDVERYGGDRKIYFSSFHPDAVEELRKWQSKHPVLFLTEGACRHVDARRNSVEAAIDVCIKSGLQGIVADVEAILRDPSLVSLVKNTGFSLLTYGDMNNIAEAVHKQWLLGLDGVIVDDVLEMATVIEIFGRQKLTIEPSKHQPMVIGRAQIVTEG